MRVRPAHCEKIIDTYLYFHWFNSSKLFYLTVNIFVVSQDAEFLCAVTSLCFKEHPYLYFKSPLHLQGAKRSLMLLGKWMRSEIVGSSGERPTTHCKRSHGRVFDLSCNLQSDFFSHFICASQISSYVLRRVRGSMRYYCCFILYKR
jgi:hypothetical protein